MALIPLKARAGIAALTFAAAVMPFVFAAPAKALTIQIRDVSDDVAVFVNGKPDTFTLIAPEHVITKFYAGDPLFGQPLQFFPSTSVETGRIGLLEPGTNNLSDLVIATIVTTVNGLFAGTGFAFASIEFVSNFPEGPIITTPGPLLVDESIIFPNPLELGTKIPFINDVTGEQLFLPKGIELRVLSGACESVCVRPIPAPVVGAGLPGLLAACAVLLAWWRRRQKIA